MPKGMQRGNREVKKPKKDKPKDKAAGYKSDTAMLMNATLKETGGGKKKQK